MPGRPRPSAPATPSSLNSTPTSGSSQLPVSRPQPGPASADRTARTATCPHRPSLIDAAVGGDASSAGRPARRARGGDPDRSGHLAGHLIVRLQVVPRTRPQWHAVGPGRTQRDSPGECVVLTRVYRDKAGPRRAWRWAAQPDGLRDGPGGKGRRVSAGRPAARPEDT
jgi:hypothetical protein